MAKSVLLPPHEPASEVRLQRSIHLLFTLGDHLNQAGVFQAGCLRVVEPDLMFIRVVLRRGPAAHPLDALAVSDFFSHAHMMLTGWLMG